MRKSLPILFLMGAIISVSFAQAQATISFKPVVQWIDESRDSASITIELTGTNATGVSFRLRNTTMGTATNGVDLDAFTKDTSFAPGITGLMTLKVKMNNDVSIESDEYSVFELTNILGANIINGSFHTLHVLDNDAKAPVANNALSLSLLSSFRNSASGTNSAEIVAYDKNTKRLWIVNSIAGKINIVNFSNPSAPVLHSTIDILPLGGINSVAIRDGVIVAAIENTNKLLPGKVVFFDADGNVLKLIDAGVLPDMVGISPDGKYVVTADEAEPSSDYLTDPEGSVTVIDISGGVAGLTQANATVISLASLNPFKGILKANGIRIFGRFGGVNDGSSVAQDLEPEFVTFSPDSKRAYITVQEANALLVIDLDSKSIATLNGGPFLKSFGLKDHSLPGNGIDASDRADSINIAKWRVKGMYMPDAIATLQTPQGTFYLTANEGDAREYTALTEETTLASLKLNPSNFPDSVVLRQQGNLGRISITNQTGDTDGDGLFDELHVLGARSFTIWDANGNRVWDSGEDLERIVEENTRTFFNANNSTGNPAIKNRSDNKGPEPEGITVATVCGRSYAFVTLERSGGVVVYDVTMPTAPVFVTYANNRTAPANASTNDVGPEGILFIPETESPTGKNLLLLANEISSSVSVFEVGCSPALPITITQFNGQLRSNDAVLQWQVADERDVQLFEIQHSRNGRQFATVGKERALGTNYQFVHNGLSTGNHYYRLTVTDRDGARKYSKTILLQIGNGGTVITGLMQNPVRSTVTAIIVTSKAQAATAMVVDASGRTLSSSRTMLQQGQTQWNINTTTLQAGIYFLTIRTEDGTTSTLRFVKQ